MEKNDSTRNNVEVWMRGPVEGVPAELQPAAHALLQAAEEIEWIMSGFADDMLWEQPAGVASVAFHLQHIPGVLDRLFTYAQAQQLTKEQLKYLSEEGLRTEHTTALALVSRVVEAIMRSIEFLKNVDPAILNEPREVGRKKLPTTVLGLLFHAAEHTMRHTGQLLVTVKIVSQRNR